MHMAGTVGTTEAGGIMVAGATVVVGVVLMFISDQEWGMD